MRVKRFLDRASDQHTTYVSRGGIVQGRKLLVPPPSLRREFPTFAAFSSSNIRLRIAKTLPLRMSFCISIKTINY